MGHAIQPGEFWVAAIGDQEHKVQIISRDAPGWWRARELGTGAEFSLPERWLRCKIPDENSSPPAAGI